MLKTDYSLVVSILQFLPLGEASWCYRAETEKASYFVKLLQHQLYAASIILPVLLQERFCYSFIHAAIPTSQGDLWCSVAAHWLVVYPFISGSMLMDSKVSSTQWQEIGRIIAAVHQTILSEDSRQLLKVEDFVPPGARGARRVLSYAISAEKQGGIEGQLASFIRSRADEIQTIITRAEQYGRDIQRRKLPFVLCHADPNQANILVTKDGQMVLVDWDGVMLAPRERDIMFFMGPEQADFLHGYEVHGLFTADRAVLAYYKYEWVVQEFADFGSRIFFSNGEYDEKLHALHEFIRLFAPGDVIEEAYVADML